MFYLKTNQLKDQINLSHISISVNCSYFTTMITHVVELYNLIIFVVYYKTVENNSKLAWESKIRQS